MSWVALDAYAPREKSSVYGITTREAYKIYMQDIIVIITSDKEATCFSQGTETTSANCGKKLSLQKL